MFGYQYTNWNLLVSIFFIRDRYSKNLYCYHGITARAQTSPEFKSVLNSRWMSNRVIGSNEPKGSSIIKLVVRETGHDRYQPVVVLHRTFDRDIFLLGAVEGLPDSSAHEPALCLIPF